MNREYSKEIVRKLLSWGVEEFYICAGARDIPLIETVNSICSEKKILFNHFEERSAAFYAIGRIKSLKKPVAIITTSGTAVGELLPAVMEAYYSGLPLVLLTADRPKYYRQTGAPQSAEQNNIFGIYVSKCYDLECNSAFDISEIPKNKPLHINVCFDIPLQSGHLDKIYKSEFTQNLFEKNTFENSETLFLNKQKLQSFFRKNENIFIIVSQLFDQENSNIIHFIKSLNYPVYIESISNIRETPELKHLRIKCPDKIWEHSQKSGYIIDGVLKIGGTPTHRIWRDLDETKKHINVLSISNNNFAGMPNAENICTNINKFLSNVNIESKRNNFKILNSFLALDSLCYKKIIDLFNAYPEAEQSIYFHLSKRMQKNSRLYLGNSLPIRYWDLGASFENNNLYVDASRGLNGIDGQISSFLGFADEHSAENWGIFGDLTALYDLAGLWMLQHRPQLKANIVIINNKGGRIFNKVLTGEVSLLCQNVHNLSFEYLAKFWNIDYEKILNVKEIKNSESTRIIEINPDERQTELFSSQFKNITGFQ